jgi:hypothetical protein
LRTGWNGLKKENINFDDLETENMVRIFVQNLLLKQLLILMLETLSFQNQIDADKFDLQDRDSNAVILRKFANQEFYPTKNYHKEWY